MPRSPVRPRHAARCRLLHQRPDCAWRLARVSRLRPENAARYRVRHLRRTTVDDLFSPRSRRSSSPPTISGCGREDPARPDRRRGDEDRIHTVRLPATLESPRFLAPATGHGSHFKIVLIDIRLIKDERLAQNHLGAAHFDLPSRPACSESLPARPSTSSAAV